MQRDTIHVEVVIRPIERTARWDSLWDWLLAPSEGQPRPDDQKETPSGPAVEGRAERGED